VAGNGQKHRRCEAAEEAPRSFVKDIVLDPVPLECGIEHAVPATDNGITR